MSKLEYTFKTDTLFKILFVQHPDLLKRLVSELLEIRLESIGQFVITNPEMPPEAVGDKFCRLDINMTVDGRQVDLEVQVQNQGNYPERALFNWARLYTSALPEGEMYQKLPRTVVISIIDFNLFGCKEFHSEYQALEVTRHNALTDKMNLHFFELPKVPEEVSENNKLLLWLSLFKADTEEELEKIKAMEVPEMNEAISAYQRITISPEFRELERLRSLARHDEATALYHARQEEREKWQGVVKNMEGVVKNMEGVVKNMEGVVADKDAEIARLREELGRK
jgi:predicted transposase/invertase (TIGR01784 family)